MAGDWRPRCAWAQTACGSGRAFIATPEARTVQGHKEALLLAAEDPTKITRGSTGKTMRVLANAYTL